MSIYFLAGREANVIESAELRTVSSEDSDFPKERAYDRFPGSVFKHAEIDPGSSEEDATYDIDLNRLLNGGFEDWSVTVVPDNWIDISTGTGAASQNQAVEVEGSSCLELDGDGGSNVAKLYLDVSVLSGWKCTVDIRLRGNGADAIIVVIQCLETGQSLNSVGAWADIPLTTFRSRSTGSFGAADPITFTMPEISDAQKHLLTLRFIISTQGANVYADAAYLFPWVDFASVHGHNINIGGAAIVFKVQHDSDSAYGSPTTQTMTIAHPSFYKVFTQVGERYWRFLADGKNILQGKYGELVLGQYQTLLPDFQAGAKVAFNQPKTIVTALNTQTYITAHTDDLQREYMLSFRAITEAQKDLLRQEIYVRTRGGADPLILVPDSNNEDVIYGKLIDENWSYTRLPYGSEAKGIYDYSIRVKEDPFGKEIA